MDDKPWLHWTVGAITNSDVWTATDPSDFLRAWIDGYPESEPMRHEARHGLLVRAARSTQDGLIETAVNSGDYRPSAREAQLLAWPKARYPDFSGYALKSVPLIIVRPISETRRRPAVDNVLEVSARDVFTTINALVRMGWLESVGVVNGSGGVDDPTRPSQDF